MQNNQPRSNNRSNRNSQEKRTANGLKSARREVSHTEPYPLPQTDAQSELSKDHIVENIRGSEQLFNQNRATIINTHVQQVTSQPSTNKDAPLTPSNSQTSPNLTITKPKRSQASREASRLSKAQTTAARKSFLSGSLISQAQIQEVVPQNRDKVLQKQSICELFKMTEEQAREMVYLVGTDEDPFWAWCFARLRGELMRALIYKLREQALAKIRTIIVRRVLDDFVAHECDLSPQQQMHLAKHNRRITTQDIQRYSDARLPSPPSRMTAQYLAAVFDRPDFQAYYKDYLGSCRLLQYLENSNQNMIQRYAQSLAEISAADVELHVKQTRMAKITRRPLFQSQIQEHLDEAVQIAADYCRPAR